MGLEVFVRMTRQPSTYLEVPKIPSRKERSLGVSARSHLGGFASVKGTVLTYWTPYWALVISLPKEYSEFHAMPLSNGFF